MLVVYVVFDGLCVIQIYTGLHCKWDDPEKTCSNSAPVLLTLQLTVGWSVSQSVL